MRRENKEEKQQDHIETPEDASPAAIEAAPDTASGDPDNKDSQISSDEAETSHTDGDDKPPLKKEDQDKPAGPKLESLSALADRHRIPAWHQAALLRYMGWQEDKMVTDEDYRNALDELKHRRIGGGRK